MRWIRRGLVLLLFAVLAAMAAAWRSTVPRVLPQTDGALTLPGCAARCASSATRTASRRSAPASATTPPFGLGFVHAQDRLWQLETHRRIGAGRLAEAFGAPALETDRFLRALGVRRAAAAQWAQARRRSRARALQAYTAGVNAFVQQRAARAAARVRASWACSPSPGRPRTAWPGPS